MCAVVHLTWHYVTDGDEAGVLQSDEITQQFPIQHTVPVPYGIVLEKSWETEPCRLFLILQNCHLGQDILQYCHLSNLISLSLSSLHPLSCASF